jgi:DNA-binding NarL/FixJ family response regulator
VHRSSAVRALIVDDRERSRCGLRALLATCAEIHIVGEATNGQEALEMVALCHPDVVLMDARMPVMDGLEATRQIKGRWPRVKVIVLTLYAAYRDQALAAGATRFLLKGGPAEELLEAVRG